MTLVPQSHGNPIKKCLTIIESYLVNYENWLEPVCFILMLEICADVFMEKYLFMLKDIFSAGLYKLPVDKDHLLEQVTSRLCCCSYPHPLADQKRRRAHRESLLGVHEEWQGVDEAAAPWKLFEIFVKIHWRRGQQQSADLNQ
jgi:hypothetical protein